MIDREIKPKSSLSAKLNRYEKNYAIFRLTDGQELFWPKEMLREGIHIGSKIHLIVKSEQEQVSESRELAKNILEQILNGKSKNQRI